MPFYSRFTSKTIWGAVIAAAGFVATNQAQLVALLPHSLGVYVTAIGGILAAIGARDAIAKNGSGN